MLFTTYTLTYDQISCQFVNRRALVDISSENQETANELTTEPSPFAERINEDFYYVYHMFCSVTEEILKLQTDNFTKEERAVCERVSEILNSFKTTNKLFNISKNHKVYSDFVFSIKEAVENENIQDSSFFACWNIFNKQELFLLELHKSYKPLTNPRGETYLIHRMFFYELTEALENAEKLFENFKDLGENTRVLIALSNWIKDRIEKTMLDYYNKTNRKVDSNILKAKSRNRLDLLPLEKYKKFLIKHKI
ncbi:hypothetical protein CDIK_1994 [Cucumispora dikerogammari]|nr:hypothetical protein CDIK_1994 [Cucumispora dikerogammari]